MTKDSVDFVRQGAYIALGLILVEQSEASSPAIASIRTTYNKVIGNKHEDPMARFGAVIGQGLIDAGGRNVTISLQSRAGTRNMSAIVGMVLFCQFWYWYPLAHCASLAFEPTGIIGLDAKLRVSPLRSYITEPYLTVAAGSEVRVHFQCQAESVRVPSAHSAAKEGDSYQSCDCCAVDHGQSQGSREEESSRRGRSYGYGMYICTQERIRN